MLGLGLGQLLWHLPFPRNDSRIRPIADYVGVHFKPGDAIYAFDHSGRVGRAWEFQCYWRGHSPVMNEWPKDLSTLPTGRIWLTYAYHPGSDSDRLTPIYNDLSHGAKLIDHFEVRGGKAFLFERPWNPPSTSPAP